MGKMPASFPPTSVKPEKVGAPWIVTEVERVKGTLEVKTTETGARKPLSECWHSSPPARWHLATRPLGGVTISQGLRQLAGQASTEHTQKGLFGRPNLPSPWD